MSFKDYKKDLDRKRQEQEILKSLNNAVNKLEKKRNEYAEKAKDMLKMGNKAQYGAYVSLLKNAMFNLAQAQDMLANYTIACDLREMQTLNRSFVRSMDNVMKEVYKTSNSINVASSQKLFVKALDKQNYTKQRYTSFGHQRRRSALTPRKRDKEGRERLRRHP